MEQSATTRPLSCADAGVKRKAGKLQECHSDVDTPESVPVAMEKMYFHINGGKHDVKDTLFKQGQRDVGNCWSTVMDTWMVLILFSIKKLPDVPNGFNAHKSVLEKRESSSIKMNTEHFESGVSLPGR